MQESYLPNYYLINNLEKIDRTVFKWPLLIVFVYFIEAIAFILVKEEITAFNDYVILLLGNSFFSIMALFLITIIYKNNILIINEWLNLNSTIVDKELVIKKLNNYHYYLFGRYQILLAISILVGRRIISWIYFPEVNPIFGYIINDTITVFLLTSLALSSLGIVILIYIMISAGIKARSPFELLEIIEKYDNINLQNIKNSFLISAELGLYGGAVYLWGRNFGLTNIAVLLDLLILLIVFGLFAVNHFATRKGLTLSKRNLVKTLNKEFNFYSYIEDEMDKADPLQKVIQILTSTNIQNILWNVNEIDKKIYNSNSLLYAAFSAIIGIIITHAIEYTLNILQ